MSGTNNLSKPNTMRKFFNWYAARYKKSIERERTLDDRVGAISKRLWPWQESKLMMIVIALVVLDFCSTFAFLELSGNTNLYEGSPIARWALEMGGFTRLFQIDLIAACVLMGAATIARFLYTKWGFKGYGRTAFVLILIPYVVVTTAAIFNNVVLTFAQ